MANLIYLGRHGDTNLNDNDIERSWSMAPLNAEGRAQAERDAVTAANKGIEVIISSDLQRAKETAQIIGNSLGIEAGQIPQLRTWNLGDFAGRLCVEVEPKIKDYIRSKPDEQVPNGESFNGFKERMFGGLLQAVNQAAGQALLLVVHSRVERVIEGWIAAGQPPDHSLDIKVVLEKPEAPGGIEAVRLNVPALGGYSFDSVFRHMRG